MQMLKVLAARVLLVGPFAAVPTLRVTCRILLILVECESVLLSVNSVLLPKALEVNSRSGATGTELPWCTGWRVGVVYVVVGVSEVVFMVVVLSRRPWWSRATLTISGWVGS